MYAEGVACVATVRYYTNPWLKNHTPGSWCLAEGGRQGQSQGPCRGSLPGRASLAGAEEEGAAARAEPGRWGLAGGGHLQAQASMSFLVLTGHCQDY